MGPYNIHEAADLLGLRPGEVRQAIRDEDLEADRDGSDYLIDRDDLEEYAEEHGINLDDDDEEEREDRVDSALEEHRPSWEAGFRSGYAAGAQDDSDDC